MEVVIVLIKNRHDQLFKSITAELLVDLGGKISVTIKRENTKTDCVWCEKDTPTGRSSGRPTPGKVWSTHEDFTNSLRCPNCFTENTLVFTDSGLKKISDISIGEKVVTKEGTFDEVVRLFSRDYSGDLIKVKFLTGYEIICTPDHKFFGFKGYKRENDKDRNGLLDDIRKGFVPKIEKIKAKDLTKYDYLQLCDLPKLDIEPVDNYVRPFKAHIKPKDMEQIFDDKDFPTIVGLYIAEGCSSKREVAFCFHAKEHLYINFVRRFFIKHGFSVRIDSRGSINSGVVCIPSVKLTKWFEENCGKRAENKKIPEFLLYSGDNIKLLKVLSGIYMGDGLKNKKVKGCSIGVVSKHLILQVMTILSRFNVHFSSYYRKACIYQGSKKQPVHGVDWTYNNKRSVRVKYINDIPSVGVQEITVLKDQNTKVYNLEVENSHTYNANGVIVKNCYGRGDVITYTETTLTSNHIEDISGQKFTKGKLGYFPAGTKRLTGLISDVEVDGENYLETAVKITIGTEDYALVSGGGGYERLGIKTDHLFRAILERTEIIEK